MPGWRLPGRLCILAFLRHLTGVFMSSRDLASDPIRAQKYPLRSPGDYDPALFVAAIDMVLASPDIILRTPSLDLLRDFTHKQITTYLKSRYGTGPSTTDMIFDTLNQKKPDHWLDISTSAGNWMKTFGYIGKTSAHAFKIERMAELMRAFEISRPVLSLTEKEKLVLRGIGAMAADGLFTDAQWKVFLARLAWRGGATNLETSSTDARIPEARGILIDFLRQQLSDHEQFLAEAAAACARAAKLTHKSASPMADVLSSGARWMTFTDLLSSEIYSTHVTPRSVVLGTMPTPGGRHEVLFDGHESLITIGGPNSRKSQAHVITNLLRYPGSAIVLDVKGDLWQKTAGYRQRHFGNVYRFAPTDPFQNTHRYNPFSFIRADPQQAAEDCTVFSYQVVVDNPKAHDPYWDSKGRDFIWAFAMMVALKADPAQRNVETLYDAISLPTDDNPSSAMNQLAAAMVAAGNEYNIPDLRSAGQALQSGLKSSKSSTHIEGVLSTARRYLSGFARSANTRAALSYTDWTPDVFRSHRGSTLYICLDTTELTAYGGIIRVILDQHAQAFVKTQVHHADAPITFFLDEMPQLSNFEFVTKLQDVGRSSGVRLWMLCQSISQLEKAFGPAYKGLLGSCRLQCFMQPDAQAAEHIGVPLGEIRDLFSGEKRPLATASDMMGRAYANKIIVTTRGDIPMLLDKVLAFEAYPDRFLAPPIIAGPGAG